VTNPLFINTPLIQLLIFGSFQSLRIFFDGPIKMAHYKEKQIWRYPFSPPLPHPPQLNLINRTNKYVISLDFHQIFFGSHQVLNVFPSPPSSTCSQYHLTLSHVPCPKKFYSCNLHKQPKRRKETTMYLLLLF